MGGRVTEIVFGDAVGAGVDEEGVDSGGAAVGDLLVDSFIVGVILVSASNVSVGGGLHAVGIGPAEGDAIVGC